MGHGWFGRTPRVATAVRTDPSIDRTIDDRYSPVQLDWHVQMSGTKTTTNLPILIVTYLCFFLLDVVSLFLYLTGREVSLAVDETSLSL